MEQIPLTPLDEMIAIDPLQILKASIPYCAPRQQRTLCIFAKMLEFQYVCNHMPAENDSLSACNTADKFPDPLEFLSHISQYCHSGTQKQIESILNLYSTISLMQLFSTDS
ncbi:MAG: hypothetical protein PHC41_02625 [Lachnospiraceae bacterium]|nr:hypothetical protein [Lachnospiraceae bacterium]MDD3615103.1 hypothetical protein [Lachnospiraceae bacterium]